MIYDQALQQIKQICVELPWLYILAGLNQATVFPAVKKVWKIRMRGTQIWVWSLGI